jgi:glycerone phosphate O-acyltransferase
LGILLVRWLFRKSGAFFLRRSFLGSSDQLYSIIFREYVQRILTDGQSLEFFIEGTRSRSGKMLHPKMGLLSIITGMSPHPIKIIL